MNTQQVNYQKSSDKLWKDENGLSIPYSRTTKTERLMERRSNQLLNHALKVNEKLVDLKQEIKEVCREVYEQYMAENNNAKSESKGNFTWHNFDRSIRIEANISEPIKFDDLGIQACKDKLDEFLSENVQTKNAYINDMILDAFQTTRGKLDTKKVLGMLKWRSKIKHKKYHEAMDHLENAIRRPKSKTYFRIFILQEDGSYENVELNLSSI